MTQLLVTVPMAPSGVGRALLVEESAGRPQAVAAGVQLVMRRRHPMLADVDVATRVDVHMPWKVLGNAAARPRRRARAFWCPHARLSMARTHEPMAACHLSHDRGAPDRSCCAPFPADWPVTPAAHPSFDHLREQAHAALHGRDPARTAALAAQMLRLQPSSPEAHYLAGVGALELHQTG